MRHLLKSVGLASLACILPVLAQANPTLSAEEAEAIAREAYVYAYPLVLMQATRDVGTNVPEPVEITPGYLMGPVNQLSHARQLVDAQFDIVVAPNADTLYTALTYDVTEEPMVFEVPDAGDIYYLMEFLDYWTDVFTSPGTRTTGNGAQSFAIVGPDWEGTLPEGVREYRSPTGHGLMIARMRVGGPADFEQVHAFQDGMEAYPLSAYGKNYTPPRGTVDPDQQMAPPPQLVEQMSAEEYFERFAELFKENPPHHNDYPIRDRMRRLGIEYGKSFDFDQAPEIVQAAMERSREKALSQIKRRVNTIGSDVNGWRVRLSSTGTYGTDYLGRAAVALAGVGANVAEDAIYPAIFADSEGRPLQSDQRYVLHFEADQLPPVNGFWSLSMYNSQFYFAENSIGRYAIRDRDGLAYGEDGSLTLYIQRESPGEGKEANWLPTPAEGEFNMMMRLYWPKTEALDTSWQPPAVKRVD